MAGYNKIDLGNQPGDGLGDGGRTGGAKINAMFEEVFTRSFILSGWLVTRLTYDPNDLSFDAFKDDDKIEGHHPQDLS